MKKSKAFNPSSVYSSTPLTIPTSSNRLQICVSTWDAKRTPYKSTTVHAYLWNMAKPEPVLIADCGDRELTKVRAKTNYLYWLAGVFTFGGWVPMGLEYRCGPEA